ncbi:hypothetical protein KOEU_17750 [Komagataeibacter europaeus]|uniref:N-acetyltransferase domain-containing protein n=1 Tax=Komagataeibacter europaeus TaxID=33995 RepID=A0A0M0EHT2_KOMEU|nr:hypothetical protein [Komagataeibacter europaeus]KON64805.1 hypothetical protein KOEU_17750 [Komagataeibacter europaeus]
MITIRAAIPDDADLIAPVLRPADRLEVARTSPLPVALSIRHSIAHSTVAAIMLDDDRPLGVFGLVEPVLLDPSIGCPWMIGTIHLGCHRKLFLRETRRWVQEWRRTHTVLTNRVDAEYSQAIRWLRWLGFTIHDPEPVGVGGALFCRAEMRG